jgi:amino acid transporter
VVFAYLGFEQAIQFGGETRNPKRNIPFAVVGAMLIGAVVYVLLDVAFVGALNRHAAAHGWASLTFTNTFGPFAALATTLSLGWLAVVLYIDAVVSPGGTGLIYTGSSARLSYALSREGYIPEAFEKINDRGVPWIGIIFAFAVGMVVFLPFPGWQKLVGFITSVSVLIYAGQCLSLAAMRRQLPDWERPFRLKGAEVLAPLGFIVANLIVLFTGWTINSKMFIAIGIGMVLLAVSQVTRPRGQRVKLDWASSAWMWPWLLGLLVLSLLSSFTGGKNDLHFGVDMAVTAVFSLIIYFFALRCRLPAAAVEERMQNSANELE